MTVRVMMDTIRHRRDFLKAARALRSPADCFLVQARRREPDEGPPIQEMRVGFTCSRKIGNAVTRNRARRRLRALAREVLPTSGRPGWDYVLVARPGATRTAPFPAMRTALLRALARLHRDQPAQAATDPSDLQPPSGTDPGATQGPQ